MYVYFTALVCSASINYSLTSTSPRSSGYIPFCTSLFCCDNIKNTFICVGEMDKENFEGSFENVCLIMYP